MVDVDEADVAVLNQNLVKSKELFNSISKSLNRISNKSTNASNKIKPVLKDVNKLTNDKQDIEKGIDKLREVSDYAERTNHCETILENSIDIIGLKKYLDTLIKLKALLQEMKSKIKKFYGILINFENLIDKLEFKLITFFKKQVEGGKFNDILLINKYFNNENPKINKILIDSRSGKLVEKMKQIENNPQNVFKPPKSNAMNMGAKAPPYEKGSNAINVYCPELIQLLNKEYELLGKLNNYQIFPQIIDHVMNDFNELVEKSYVSYFNESNLIAHDTLILEIEETLSGFSDELSNKFNQKITDYNISISMNKLNNIFKLIFKEYLKFIEYKIQGVEKITELNSTELVVEIITRIRKISEYPVGLNNLIVRNYNIGEWLNVKLLKFIGIYTSVIKNDMEEPQRLSNFVSDLIDCIMINLETKLRDVKKSTQGFYLIKNTVLIETIINRLNNLFEILGSLGSERLAKLKNRFLKLFLDDWNYASYIIIRDMTQLTTLSATNQSNELSSKEKDSIKKLFETFNESFEAAVKNYEKFNILDPNLKHYLISEIKKLIMNAYFKLYDKYGTSNFTKSKSKYIKYNKLEFENVLNDRLG